MGLGRFGGGVGVARFLAGRGADVRVTDMLPADELSAGVAQLEGWPGVELRLGGHNVSDFSGCDLLVVNPAVKPGNRFVRVAQAAGVEITSEIRLLAGHLPDRRRVIGVTGSAGKSTVSAMIYHVLDCALAGDVGPSEAGASAAKVREGGARVWLGGNIGGSLLPQIDEIGGDDWVVLELSSFMLEGLRKDRWSPHIAVLTNISPNHLDWHGSMDAYTDAKRVLAAFQEADDLQIAGSESARDLLGPAREVVHPIDANSLPALAVPGDHNRVNAATAAAAVRAALGPDADVSALAAFPGLPHRLQRVGQLAGVSYFNDSKSTTPEAARLAIAAFAPQTVRIVLGGSDKGSDLAPLARFAAEHCAGVYTIGTTGDAIADAAQAYAPSSTRPGSCGGVTWPPPTAAVRRCGTLAVAVDTIAADAKPGDNVVLSPGCASWDQFANYEARGDVFVAAIADQRRCRSSRSPTPRK